MRHKTETVSRKGNFAVVKVSELDGEGNVVRVTYAVTNADGAPIRSGLSFSDAMEMLNELGRSPKPSSLGLGM